MQPVAAVHDPGTREGAVGGIGSSLTVMGSRPAASASERVWALEAACVASAGVVVTATNTAATSTAERINCRATTIPLCTNTSTRRALF